ncbi:MAG: hypothetical protein EPO07_14645 [Verrucomicrobia bacterium]|nr:MAG: hypothetical protein EPO07_14645 [Verrucomicrobiota bacterium]
MRIRAVLNSSPCTAATLVLMMAAPCLCFAGHEMKWADVPEAVRATVLANGGVAGQTVDRENGKIKGQTVYEAGVKDKDGSIADLVITEDGKLVDTKHDDAADAAAEKAQAASGKKVSATMKFSHPRDLTNPLLPLAYLKQDILEGTEGGQKIRIERTVLPNKHKKFKIAGQTIDALVMEDREIKNGELEEVTLDYFAQDDEGTVYYLGEDVDEYDGGKVKGHSGAWLFGKDTQHAGVIIPAHPKVGDKFKSEDVNKEIHEDDEVVAVGETVSVPAGTYENCVKVKEMLADGEVEFKFYAPGVGVVREVPKGGDVVLKSHTTR